MSKKKVRSASEIAKLERQAVEFLSDGKLHKKGDKQLLSTELANLLIKRKQAKKIEVDEIQYEKIIRFGKI